MKRWLVAVSALVLTACGASSSSPETTAPSASPSPTTEAVPESPTTTALLPLDLDEPFSPERSTNQQRGITLLPTPDDEELWLPPSLLPGKPGDVIWMKSLTKLPLGELFFVMYHSSDTFGRSVGVTGWLAIPNDVTSSTSVFSWGHGTTGMADDCAPTRESSPVQIPFLNALLERGLIVAATDYAYLGTPGPHPYFDASTMAFSMIDAAVAAQNFTGAGGPTFFGGYSIGGRGAVFAQSLAPVYAPDLEIAGTAIFRPGVDGSGNSNAYRLLRDSPLKGYAVMAFYGVNLAWGKEYFDLEQYLTPQAIELLPLLDRDCRQSVLDAFQPLSGDEVFLISQTDELPGRSADASQQISEAPLLISAGVIDSTIGRSAINAYLDDACSNGQEIELHWLMQEHGLDQVEDRDLLMDWIDRVFEGSTTNNCDGGVTYPPLCPDDPNTCFKINIATTVDGERVNPLGSIRGTNWEVLAETTTAAICPQPTFVCTGEIFDGHVTQLVKSPLSIDVADAEAWLTEGFYLSVDGFWSIALYKNQDHPCKRKGYYFQMINYNQMGQFIIVPSDNGSTIYGILSHNNRTTIADWGEVIRMSGEWPC